MPLLKAPVELTPSRILQAWADLWPGGQGPGNVEVKDGAMTFDLGAAHVAGKVMPVPVPNNEVFGPASTSWLWPAAVNDLHGYGAHVVVYASAADSHLDAFRAMTQAAAAIVRSTNALGVYLGGAGLVVRGDVFVGMAQDMDIPVALWVDLRCVNAGDGRSGLFTVGMKQFGLMEIEIPSSAKGCGDLRMWTMSLASWLIESRPTINAGETVGLSEDERIPVEHARSMIDREGLVMRLTGV